jgi:hypothetical protein
MTFIEEPHERLEVWKSDGLFPTPAHSDQDPFEEQATKFDFCAAPICVSRSDLTHPIFFFHR